MAFQETFSQNNHFQQMFATYNSSASRHNNLRAVRSVQDGPSQPNVRSLGKKVFLKNLNSIYFIC